MHELLAAGIDCRPVATSRRAARQHHHQRARRHHHQAQQPRTRRSPPRCSPRSPSRCSAAPPQADWVVLAGSLPPGAPVGWYAELVAALRDTGARIAVDTSDAPLRALVDGLDGRRAAPDEAQRRGAGLLHRRRRRRARVRPRSPPRAPRATLVDRGVETVLATLGPHGAVLVNADGAWHATPPQTVVVSTVGAGDSSLFGYLLGDLRHAGPRPTTRARRRLRQRGRRTSRHDHPATPPGPTRAGLGRAASTSPREGDHVRSHHRRSGAPRRRPRRRQARRDPGARPGRRRRRPRHRRRPARRGRLRPRGEVRHRPPGRHRHPPLPHRGRRGADARLRPAGRRRSTSAPRTARPTWCS